MNEATTAETSDAHRDPLLEALVFIARAHDRGVSRDGLTAGLPLENQRLTPELISRAAERARLDAQVLECPVRAIGQEQCPAILLCRDGGALVLLSQDGSEASLVNESGKHNSMALDELSHQYLGSAVLLRPIFDFDERVPELGTIRRRHWFWSALLQNRSLYRDVLLAATLINVFALALPLFTMNVYDRVVPNRAVETLWMLAIGVLIVLVGDFTLRSMRAYFLDLGSKRIDLRLTSFLMERVLGMRLEERPASAGSFAANLRSFEMVRDFITSATVSALIDLPFAALFVAVIGWIAWPMVIPVLIAMLLIFAYASSCGSRMHDLAESGYRAAAMRNATLIESLIGLESIKTLGAEGIMQGRLERSAAFLATNGASMRLLSNSTISAAMLAQQAVTVSIIVIGVYLISEGQLSLGGLIACTMLGGRAMAPFGQVAGLMTQYHQAATAMTSLDQIVAKEVERPPGSHFVTRERFQGDIEFRNVSFAYPNTELNALRGVSFRINAGENVAILGRTGSGKSTILRLVMGLYQPTDGSVLIDGIDVRQLHPGELRGNVGYVPQDVTLFYGSLRDNLTLGAPFTEDADILAAAEIGNLLEYVNQHPHGFEMIVGERGESLSGGQREAVAVARAVISKPPVLLLDEPTGSMDHSSEEIIKQKLKEFSKDRTMMVITHRNALLELVDRIIVVDQGKVVADGPKATVVKALSEGRVSKSV